MTDYTELKRLAEASRVANHDERGPDEAFQEALHPEVVLALIAENERLSGECEGCPMRVAEELRAENAGLRTGYQAYERVNAELKAENEALRADADKWKIVQRCMDVLQADEREASIWTTCSRLLISTAHNLNSAISTVLEEGVTIGEEKIGDWRVTVERIDAAMGKGEK